MNELTPIDGGWCIKVRDDGEYCIDVMQMLFSYRVVLSIHPGHMFIEHGWCYFAQGQRTMPQALMAAVLAANVWDGYGAPMGYDKQAC